MGVDFVSPDVFKFGSLVSPKKERKKQERKKNSNPIPKSLADPEFFTEPVVDTPECRVLIHRVSCPHPECEYVSGRYVNQKNSKIALRGHYRWVHNWRA